MTLDTVALRPLLDTCVHCGFCLPACPTYTLWGREADSPRGRIHLVDAVARGRLPLDGGVARHLDLCLGCMACMPACPSGVRYDRILEEARAAVAESRRRPSARLSRAALLAVLPHPRLLRAAAPLLAPVGRAAGRRRASSGGGRVRAALRLAAAASRSPGAPAAAPIAPAAPAGRPRLRVAVVTGCVQSAWFGSTTAATARVLAAHGCEVVVPPGQGCCGALDLHVGRRDAARRRAGALARRLDATGADRVVVDAAGCGSAIKEWERLRPDDEVAVRVAGRARDVTELLDELGPPAGALQALPLRVAYHDACHLAHAQGLREQPRRVLRRIPGLELVELPPSGCCGSAGVYNLVEPRAAAELGRLRAEAVLAGGAPVVATANPGCITQLLAHLPAGGPAVVHPVEIVDASLRGLGPAAVTALRHP